MDINWNDWDEIIEDEDFTTKYRYTGKSTINIEHGQIINDTPTTWSIKNGNTRKEIQVLYVKDFNGYDFPIKLDKFEKLI